MKYFEVKEYFDYNYAINFIIIHSVRVFGEELIFRGFLLTKDIKNNKTVFWILNILQASIFSYIHSFGFTDITLKISFTLYVFIFSILSGWINRKYNSLLPSWIIHQANGLQHFFFHL